MFSLKNKRAQSGFTIVELLIVIVVIGILAALVVTTYSGIQARARDSERQTDIQALQTQIEAYFATANVYPTLDQLNDANGNTNWRETNMKSLGADAMTDPSNTSNTPSLLSGSPASATNKNVYGYVATGCAADGSGCTGYTLSAWLESSTKAYTKSALD